ncbi:hypothetical protein NKH41_26520 [Mesorhizobium sp. M1169]|uniref:hypothetical protein n=1 Tax=Mesorhizobium sp. M1169 TaxID=2957066 RepID=UPI003335E4B9
MHQVIFNGRTGIFAFFQRVLRGCAQGSVSMERREYETATDKGRPGQRLVRLPGDKQHTKRGDSAKVIARRIALDKAEKRLQRLTNG